MVSSKFVKIAEKVLIAISKVPQTQVAFLGLCGVLLMISPFLLGFLLFLIPPVVKSPEGRERIMKILRVFEYEELPKASPHHQQRHPQDLDSLIQLVERQKLMEYLDLVELHKKYYGLKKEIEEEQEKIKASKETSSVLTPTSPSTENTQSPLADVSPCPNVKLTGQPSMDFILPDPMASTSEISYDLEDEWEECLDWGAKQ